jgi:hypothetical protein
MPAPMRSTTDLCLTRTRCITGSFPIREWWRSSCASLFRRPLPPASISPDCEELEALVSEVIGWLRQHPDCAAEGKAEGKAEALVCLLAERFGTVRPSLRKRILGADLATLECWFKRAIVAPDLPSVFDHAS